MSRSSKKGPWVEERLMTRIEAMNSATRRRWSHLVARLDDLPRDGRHTIAVHDGRKHIPVFVSESMAPQARRVRADAEPTAATPTPESADERPGPQGSRARRARGDHVDR
jgi:small subunit ribosomal protein S19